MITDLIKKMLKVEAEGILSGDYIGEHHDMLNELKKLSELLALRRPNMLQLDLTIPVINDDYTITIASFEIHGN
jgi:hypothetical protein|tara:strand:+ start:2878 stop:3099 length:222 start_codon:yes stop_codon:yes gene_type:complete